MRIALVLLAVAALTVACGQAGKTPIPVADNSTYLVIEQYGTMDDRPPLGLLRSSEVRDPAAVDGLVQDIAALPPFPSGFMSCPMDDGSHFEIHIFQSSRASADYKVEASGCAGVYLGDNQRAIAWAARSPQLFDVLNKLLGA